MTDLVSPAPPLAPRGRSESRTAAYERLRLLARSPTVVIGSAIVVFWVFCAVFTGLVTPHDPIFDNQFPTNEKPS